MLPSHSGTAILGRYETHLQQDRLDPHGAGPVGAQFQEGMDSRKFNALQNAKDRGIATPAMIEHITAMPGMNPYALLVTTGPAWAASDGSFRGHGRLRHAWRTAIDVVILLLRTGTPSQSWTSTSSKASARRCSPFSSCRRHGPPHARSGADH